MEYRNDLPQPIPDRIRPLPVQNGYPVPWFVAKVNETEYDFRCIDSRKMQPAIKKKLCWICGQKLGAYLAFPIGSMCAINRRISEPPAHRECAEWTIKACPFLAQKQLVRREHDLPENIKEPGGIGIKRQPGVVCVWITRSYKVINADNGLLFKLGDPLETLWFRQGRPATRAECIESIDSGYPILLEYAQQDGEKAIRMLESMREKALTLLPKESAQEVLT